MAHIYEFKMTRQDFLALMDLLSQLHHGEWESSDSTIVRFRETRPGYWELSKKPGETVYVKPVEAPDRVKIPFQYSNGTKPADCFFEFMEWVRGESVILGFCKNPRTSNRRYTDEEWEEIAKTHKEIDAYATKNGVAIEIACSFYSVKRSTYYDQQDRLRKRQKNLSSPT